MNSKVLCAALNKSEGEKKIEPSPAVMAELFILERKLLLQ